MKNRDNDRRSRSNDRRWMKRMNSRRNIRELNGCRKRNILFVIIMNELILFLS